MIVSRSLRSSIGGTIAGFATGFFCRKCTMNTIPSSIVDGWKNDQVEGEGIYGLPLLFQDTGETNDNFTIGWHSIGARDQNFTLCYNFIL